MPRAVGPCRCAGVRPRAVRGSSRHRSAVALVAASHRWFLPKSTRYQPRSGSSELRFSAPTFQGVTSAGCSYSQPPVKRTGSGG
jgi:hypothetical protein